MANASNKLVTGTNGVHLKGFEKVLVDVLPIIRPTYSKLPPRPSEEWPFDELPPESRVFGPRKGQINNESCAKRKEDQIRSLFQCIFALLPTPRNNSPSAYTIVDFGGGSGHLSIPLALYLPDCDIICVDLKKQSLDLLHEKANRCSPTTNQTYRRRPLVENCLQQCQTIPNLYSFLGPIEDFDLPFDMGVALHLCGQSTDVALRKCHDAQALIFSPCCVGKLNKMRKNPYIYLATGENVSAVNYPQSQIMCQLVRTDGDWNHLAKAADYSAMNEFGTSRNATRRVAKAVLETDRQRFLQETFGFATALVRMDPWDVSPKNDVLLGWKEVDLVLEEDDECNADVQLALNHLFGSKPVENDWTLSEEAEIRQTIENRLLQNDRSVSQYTFPTGMGRRKRKLIHSVAEAMGMRHWGVGANSADRAVAVAPTTNPLIILPWMTQDDNESSDVLTPLPLRIVNDNARIMPSRISQSTASSNGPRVLGGSYSASDLSRRALPLSDTQISLIRRYGSEPNDIQRASSSPIRDMASLMLESPSAMANATWENRTLLKSRNMGNSTFRNCTPQEAGIKASIPLRQPTLTRGSMSEAASRVRQLEDSIPLRPIRKKSSAENAPSAKNFG